MKSNFKSCGNLLYGVWRQITLLLLIGAVQFQSKAASIPVAHSLAVPNIGIQQGTVRGKVIDESGTPLSGVSIVEKGTPKGVVSGSNGNYEITGLSDGAILIFSYLGKTTEEVAVNGQTTINVTMVDDAHALDEVVAVGYGVQKKSDLTGAVSSIKTGELNKSTSTSIAQLLQGQAPGLQAFQNSAQPGGSVNLLIRGASSLAASNAPLIVIDGFATSGVSHEPNSFYGSGSTDNALNSLNPNDIESIEVLKDASSTAIYGARAANGVILITTKRGKKGKLKIAYEPSITTQRFSETWDILGARDYMLQANRILKENWRFQNGLIPYGTTPEDQSPSPFTPRYTDDDIREKSGNPTDWLGGILRRGSIHQHNLSLSGGTDEHQYLVSLNYFDQGGIVKHNNFNRVTGRVNFDQKIGKHFKLGISSMITKNGTANIPINGGVGQNSFGIIQLALSANPTIPIQNEDGTYPLDPNNTFTPNPASLLEITDETKFSREFVNSFIAYEPLPGLEFRASFGYDGSNTQRNQYIPKSTREGAARGGLASIATTRFDNYLFEGYGRYQVQLSDHDFSVLGGYSYQKFDFSGENMLNTDFLFDSFKWYNIGSGRQERPTLNSNGGSSNLISYFTRLNYSYKDKYLLTANFRTDGSPKFAENKQWGYFPSFSMGWRVSQEAFFQPVKPILSNLKLRIGYGVTGNDDIGSRTVDAYTTGKNYGFGNSLNLGVSASQIGNPNLKWESTKEWNLGVDFGFFGNRINGSMELYDRRTDDLLSWRTLPYHNEITEIPDNIGAIRSKGFELGLNAMAVHSKKFQWNISVTFASNEVFWADRGDAWRPDIYQGEHDPVRAIYAHISDGLVYPEEIGSPELAHMVGINPGTIKLLDVNGYARDESGAQLVDDNGRFIYLGEPDGILDNADMRLIGSWDPKYNFGISNTFKYGNLDVSFYMTGLLDYWKVNQTRLAFSRNAYRVIEGLNIFEEVKTDSWSSDNPTGTRPNVIIGMFNKYGYGDYDIEKANFLRLKNLTVGYTLPIGIIGGSSHLRFFASLDNLFVLTSYSGPDPETDSMAGYPNQKSYTLGLNLNF